jgi:predicted RNase H-like HicB family nuclease
MIDLLKTIQANITSGDESGYVAECREIAIVTQGRTLDEVTFNLREAVALYFEGENPIHFGFSEKPSLVITIELQPAYA